MWRNGTRCRMPSWYERDHAPGTGGMDVEQRTEPREHVVERLIRDRDRTRQLPIRERGIRHTDFDAVRTADVGEHLTNRGIVEYETAIDPSGDFVGRDVRNDANRPRIADDRESSRVEDGRGRVVNTAHRNAAIDHHDMRGAVCGVAPDLERRAEHAGNGVGCLDSKWRAIMMRHREERLSIDGYGRRGALRIHHHHERRRWSNEDARAIGQRDVRLLTNACRVRVDRWSDLVRFRSMLDEYDYGNGGNRHERANDHSRHDALAAERRLASDAPVRYSFVGGLPRPSLARND